MVIKRDKTIRRIGDSLGIIFNKEEQSMYKINVGDIVNVSIEKLTEETQ